MRRGQVPGPCRAAWPVACPTCFSVVGRRKCGPKIGKRVIAAGSSKFRISLNPAKPAAVHGRRDGHDISLLSHPSQALRYFVSLLFKVYGLLGVVQLESLSSLFNIPLHGLLAYGQHQLSFFETNPVNSKPDLLATSQSFTNRNQTKQSDENRRQILNTIIWLRKRLGLWFFFGTTTPNWPVELALGEKRVRIASFWTSTRTWETPACDPPAFARPRRSTSTTIHTLPPATPTLYTPTPPLTGYPWRLPLHAGTCLE